MNCVVPIPPSLVYDLAEDLRARAPAGWLSIHCVSPNETDLEILLYDKLGLRGWTRLNEFRYCYGAGWGEGSFPALSPKARASLFRFLSLVNFPADVTPSIFLTNDGGIELCWEDVAGKAVQVEFRPGGIEYFLAASGEEAEIEYVELPDLARRLSA